MAFIAARGHWILLLGMVLQGCGESLSCEDRLNELWLISPSQFDAESGLSKSASELKRDIRETLSECASKAPVFDVATSPGEAPAQGSVMQLAVMLDDTQLLSEYFDRGIPLAGLRDPGTGYSTLHTAAMFGSVDSAAWLLERGLSPEIRGVENLTPLMLTSFRTPGHRKVATMLVAHGADITAVDEWGNNLEYFASAAGDAEFLAWVRGEVTKREGQGSASTELQACESDFNRLLYSLQQRPVGDTSVRQELLAFLGRCDSISTDYQVGDNLVSEVRRQNIQHVAVILDEPELIEEYEGLGVRIDGKVDGYAGDSTLSTAAAFGSTKSARWLIERGVSPNDKGYEGFTPLMFASRETDAHRQVVELLLSQGASIDAVTDDGDTLQSLVSKRFGPEFAEWLLRLHQEIHQDESD